MPLARPALASAPAARGRIRAQAVHGLRVRLSSPRRVLLVLLSLSVWAATHVVWDAFTHAGRWGTAHVPWLADEHGLLPGYRWAQYGGGVFGVLVVGLARWWQSNTAASPASGLRPAVAVGAWLLVLVAGAAGAAVGSIGPLTSPEGPDLRSAFFLAATRDIAPAVFVALLFAASWHLVAGRQPADGGDLAREGENT